MQHTCITSDHDFFRMWIIRAFEDTQPVFVSDAISQL
jgi:hypothetical protein